MRRKYPISISEDSGFSLIETLAALAISSATVMIVGAGLFFVLQAERSALRTSRTSLMSKSVESAERLEPLRAIIGNEYDQYWIISTDRLDRDDRQWVGWLISPRDSARQRTRLFFLDKEGERDI